MTNLRTSPNIQQYWSVLLLRLQSSLPAQILIFDVINIAIYINNEFVRQKLISTRRLHVIRNLINFTEFI